MGHIHTEPGQYDVTVGTYVFRIDTPEPVVVLHMHKKLGAYMQFGGHIELDESPWAAAVREVQEESGYALSQLQVLQPQERMTHISEGVLHPTPLCLVTFPYGGMAGHFHSDIAYALIATGDPEGGIAADESADLRHFTRAEVAAGGDAMLGGVRDIALFVFDKVLPQWQRVDAADFARTEPVAARN